MDYQVTWDFWLKAGTQGLSSVSMYFHAQRAGEVWGRSKRAMDPDLGLVASARFVSNEKIGLHAKSGQASRSAPVYGQQLRFFGTAVCGTEEVVAVFGPCPESICLSLEVPAVLVPGRLKAAQAPQTQTQGLAPLALAHRGLTPHMRVALAEHPSSVGPRPMAAGQQNELKH